MENLLSLVTPSSHQSQVWRTSDIANIQLILKSNQMIPAFKLKHYKNYSRHWDFQVEESRNNVGKGCAGLLF